MKKLLSVFLSLVLITAFCTIPASAGNTTDDWAHMAGPSKVSVGEDGTTIKLGHGLTLEKYTKSTFNTSNFSCKLKLNYASADRNFGYYAITLTDETAHPGSRGLFLLLRPTSNYTLNVEGQVLNVGYYLHPYNYNFNIDLTKEIVLRGWDNNNGVYSISFEGTNQVYNFDIPYEYPAMKSGQRYFSFGGNCNNNYPDDGSYSITVLEVNGVSMKGSATTSNTTSSTTSNTTTSSSSNTNTSSSSNTNTSSSSSTTSSSTTIINNNTTIINNNYVTIVQISGAKLEAAEGVFPKDAVIEILKVKNGEMYNVTEDALGNISERFSAYDITATSNNTAVQPDGTVKATFDIPKNYDLDNTVLYYVSPDGEIEEIPSEIDKTNRLLTAELSHFSTYVVTEKAVDTAQDGISTVNIVLICIIVALVSGIAVFAIKTYIDKKKAKTADVIEE